MIQIIENELKNLGYYIYRDTLSAINYGISQIRRRLFIIASKQILKCPFPQATHEYSQNDRQLDIFKFNLERCPTLWEAISDLPEIEAREGKEEIDYLQKPVNQYQQQRVHLIFADISVQALHIALRAWLRLPGNK